MGLILGGVASGFRKRWAWAGILLALAVLSQQFALLVAAPLLVVAPPTRRLRFVVAGGGTALCVVVPLLLLHSGKVLRAVTLGSGDSSGVGGTAVRLLRLHGFLLAGVSRVLPIALAVLLAWWLLRLLGDSVREPLPLTALLALSLSLRLLFEENLHHTYYFMALAVSILLLDVVRGHIRGIFVVWVLLCTFAYNAGFSGLFNRVSWRLGATEHLPEAVVVLALVLVVSDLARGRVRWYLVGWIVVMVGAFASWPFTNESLRGQLPFCSGRHSSCRSGSGWRPDRWCGSCGNGKRPSKMARRQHPVSASRVFHPAPPHHQGPRAEPWPGPDANHGTARGRPERGKARLHPSEIRANCRTTESNSHRVNVFSHRFVWAVDFRSGLEIHRPVLTSAWTKGFRNDDAWRNV